MIPNYIHNIADKIVEAGFEVYMVGGSLRNLLMGQKPKDFDLTTSALPEEIQHIFPESIMTNAKFGTVTILANNEFGELQSVEITTYREEKEYIKGRWPAIVEFTRNIYDDLKRRDYTVNAIAFKLGNPESRSINSVEDIKKSKLLLDLFGGLADIEGKVLRAVGDPVKRFTEDGLRPLRGCRIASVYGFEFDHTTFNAIPQTLNVAAQISMERVRNEFMRMIKESPKPSVGIELMRKSGLLQLYIPELLEGYGMEQNRYHVYDVYEHSLRALDIAPVEIRLAALFHDIGKPRCKNGEHFYGHDKVGAEMTRKIMERLKFPKQEIDETVNLVRWHMFYVPKTIVEEEAKINDDVAYRIKIQERNTLFKLGWSDKAIRRLILRVGGHEQIDKLIKLRIADALANPKSSFDPTDIELLAQRIAEIREEDSLMSITDLKIKGDDIIELGIKPGPSIKKVLEYLLERVIDDIQLNNRESLLQLAKEYIQNMKINN
jgi:poly(A) polymerase/tRNA nucleotidyltransferase (CCA-adding enzyme)